ncbi:MAG TPA: M1 family metallopeptidase [Steroidobacteraceae bacterium]|nr:M1 family metallopeptidase [Steroidobacteraceae bacterium]
MARQPQPQRMNGSFLLLIGAAAFAAASLPALGERLQGAAGAAELAARSQAVLPDDVIPTHYDLEITPDAGHLRFSGHVSIDLQVQRPTRTIVLNALDLTFERVSLAGRDAVPVVQFDPAHQTASLTFRAPLEPGAARLSIIYRGIINTNAAGLFALPYNSAAGRQVPLFTQFENSDARRFLPCWDEPARKATFTLSANVPAREMAVSNMPVAASQGLPHGRKLVRFAATPRMSSYLLFFASGDFERITRRVDGVELGVIVKRGSLAQARFALDAAAHLLPYYDQYFAYPYPLPKLDLIAAPGGSQFFSAMENWGAMFFFEPALLVDPQLATQSDEREVYVDIAHEMAHQWFGDLVTMQWWNDLWLNEGFASWMENKATDRFHPRWHLALEAQNQKDSAMDLDARRGTHPVIQPITDVLQANEAFDAITYLKGEAVVQMLESYLGEERFRDGVRAYIRAHAYGNTVSDDLWVALERSSGVPVTQIAHDFTLQPGVPLIRGELAGSGLRLTQERFSEDDSGPVAASWRVPVFARALATDTAWRGIVSRQSPQTVLGGVAFGSRGALLNLGQSGYFRSLYAPSLLAALLSGYGALAPIDALGLADDSYALGTAGYEPIGDFLQLAEHTDAGLDPAVLQDMAERLLSIDRLYAELPQRARFQAFGRHVLAPLLAAIGYTARPRESEDTPPLRESLYGSLGELADPEVLGYARERFAAYRHNPRALVGEEWRNVLTVVAEQADPTSWEELHQLARGTRDTLARETLYRLLASAANASLARQALALALSDEVAETLRPTLISIVAVRHPQAAFDFALAHLDAVMASVEPDSRSSFMPELASHGSDPALARELEAYAAAHIPASARESTVQAQAQITFQAQVRTQRLPEIAEWLQAHAPAAARAQATAQIAR